MGSLIDQVPAAVFWSLVVGWVLGALSAWRFARVLERMRDAVRHAQHHYRAALGFASHARGNVVAMVYALAVFAGVLGVVGCLAWARVTGG